jgi:hypothetical protein
MERIVLVRLLLAEIRTYCAGRAWCDFAPTYWSSRFGVSMAEVAAALRVLAGWNLITVKRYWNLYDRRGRLTMYYREAEYRGGSMLPFLGPTVNIRLRQPVAA